MCAMCAGGHAAHPCAVLLPAQQTRVLERVSRRHVSRAGEVRTWPLVPSWAHCCRKARRRRSSVHQMYSVWVRGAGGGEGRWAAGRHSRGVQANASRRGGGDWRAPATPSRPNPTHECPLGLTGNTNPSSSWLHTGQDRRGGWQVRGGCAAPPHLAVNPNRRPTQVPCAALRPPNPLPALRPPSPPPIPLSSPDGLPPHAQLHAI